MWEWKITILQPQKNNWFRPGSTVDAKTLRWKVVGNLAGWQSIVTPSRLLLNHKVKNVFLQWRQVAVTSLIITNSEAAYIICHPVRQQHLWPSLPENVKPESNQTFRPNFQFTGGQKNKPNDMRKQSDKSRRGRSVSELTCLSKVNVWGWGRLSE